MLSTKKFSYLLVGLIGFLSPFMAFAAPQIQLEASSNSVTLDEPLQLYITIQQDKTSNNLNLSTPEISGLESFKVIGQSSSTSMQIINGVGAATLEQQLQVMPQKEGQFTIGPVQAEFEGKMVQSNTVEVSVIPSPTETLKQSLLKDSMLDKPENNQEKPSVSQDDNPPSVPPIQPLGEAIKVSNFSSANWWFWSIVIALMVTLGGGIWIGKNLAKRS